MIDLLCGMCSSLVIYVCEPQRSSLPDEACAVQMGFLIFIVFQVSTAFCVPLSVPLTLVLTTFHPLYGSSFNEGAMPVINT
jgi:hypothetical protein